MSQVLENPPGGWPTMRLASGTAIRFGAIDPAPTATATDPAPQQTGPDMLPRRELLQASFIEAFQAEARALLETARDGIPLHAGGEWSERLDSACREFSQ